jgi:1-deoxy-D-xylulose-5-phosphate reductoisomerase
MGDATAAQQLHERFCAAGLDIEVLAGMEGLETAATLRHTHYVMAAIVGAAGLTPTLAAARAGKRILLANKEALVMAGPLFMDEVHRHSAELLPIDSEHNALFQCLPANGACGDLSQAGIIRMLLTGSGGPFRKTPLAQLPTVTPEQACAHPNWNMGRKISVDSATMMNKGLEVIEACWLFNATPAQVQVVVHPQSIIHSMVEYADGSVLAQLGNPDMRTPIAHALAWPQRMHAGVAPLNFLQMECLAFQAPDFARFPCLRLAFAALNAGGTASVSLNAANEVAVQAFLEKQIRFTDIYRVIEHTLEHMPVSAITGLHDVFETDSQARRVAWERVYGLQEA